MELPIRKLEQSQQEALVFLGKVGLGISAENLIKKQFGKYDGIFLILDEEDAVSGNVLSLPEADCVSIRFRGGHTEAPDIYRRLMDYIHQNSLTPIGFSREITMIDRGLTSDPEKFVTEISIPIQKS